MLLIRHKIDRQIMQQSITEILRGWFGLSRPPFHTVGVLPFILGTFLAYHFNSSISIVTFALGVLAVILIMLSTYHSGEYFDIREDEISHHSYRSNFAGGSGVIQEGKLPRSVALWTSIISFLVAGVIGLILQFGLETGPYTLLLGCLGAFPGFFYSTKPVRLVERGFGEIFIGFCYGWLPIASAFYIQTASVHPVIHFMGIPVGLTIFNVIFLNEFPDYEADKATGKRNLLNRCGKKAGKIIYCSISLSASLLMMLSPFFGLPFPAVCFYIPIFFVSLFIIMKMMQDKYEDRKTLETMCALNIIVNLGTTAVFIAAYV